MNLPRKVENNLRDVIFLRTKREYSNRPASRWSQRSGMTPLQMLIRGGLTGTPEGHPEVASLVKNFQRVLSQTRFLTLAEPDREMCLLPRVGDTVLRPAQLLFLI